MYLIVGLGNPEQEYKNTRHNMGFETINELAKELKIEINKNKFKGLYGSGIIEGEKVLLLKPQTYMNLSGESVQEAKNYFKIEPENILVIYDDIDLEPGIVRIRKTGGPGTHNGMKSVVEQLGIQNFPRIRIGIGKPKENIDLINHVIGGISKEDKELLENGINKAKDAIIEIIKNGIDKTMNKYN